MGLPGDSKAYVSDLLKQYDRNSDGSIDWEEYKRYVVRKERVVQRTFQKLDADGSGSISAEELVNNPTSLLWTTSLGILQETKTALYPGMHMHMAE